MANEFITRKGLIIQSLTTGTTETNILVTDNDGLVKVRSSISLGGTSGTSGSGGTSGFLLSGSTAGNTPYWDGSVWVLNSSNIFNNGGNIGIGTTSPQSRLDVRAQGALSTDIAFRVRNSGDTVNLFTVNSEGETFTKIERWTFDLTENTLFKLYAEDNYSIDEITNIVGSPTITILVNSSAYTLGIPISLGDEIEIMSDIPSVIKLKIVK